MSPTDQRQVRVVALAALFSAPRTDCRRFAIVLSGAPNRWTLGALGAGQPRVVGAGVALESHQAPGFLAPSRRLDCWPE